MNFQYLILRESNRMSNEITLDKATRRKPFIKFPRNIKDN